MPYFEKDNIVKYIIRKHFDLKNYEISPVKLQKTLYLLYAMWAGNAKIMNSNGEAAEGISEYQNVFQTDLFEPKFEAWRYGPVDREVYKNFKQQVYLSAYNDETKLNFMNARGVESTLASFIDSILRQTFDISDFSLVDLTHEDVTWIDTFKKDTTGQTKMLKEEITNEYAERFRKGKA